MDECFEQEKKLSLIWWFLELGLFSFIHFSLKTDRIEPILISMETFLYLKQHIEIQQTFSLLWFSVTEIRQNEWSWNEFLSEQIYIVFRIISAAGDAILQLSADECDLWECRGGQSSLSEPLRLKVTGQFRSVSVKRTTFPVLDDHRAAESDIRTRNVSLIPQEKA